MSRLITTTKIKGQKVDVWHGLGICAACGKDTKEKYYGFQGNKYHKSCLNRILKAQPNINHYFCPRCGHVIHSAVFANMFDYCPNCKQPGLAEFEAQQ